MLFLTDKNFQKKFLISDLKFRTHKIMKFFIFLIKKIKFVISDWKLIKIKIKF